MRDCKICRIYSDIQDKVTSVIFAKKIAEEEERKRKLKVLIICISVGVAVVAAIATAAVFLASKTQEGERRGKLLVEKIKGKFARKAEECECEEEDFECCECQCEEADITVEE